MAQLNTQPIRILIADDEPAARSALGEMLREDGYEVQTAADGFKALGKVDEWVPDVVITDVKMPALGGIELMQKLRERFPDVAVIVMTAFGSVEGAVEAMRLGADDYLSKPVHYPQLMLVLSRVLKHRALQREAHQLRDALRQREAPSAGVVGQSKPFHELLDLVRQVAASPVSVLILGETGTGKSFLARLLHKWSPRASGNFVVLLCGSMNEAVLERELFGSVVDGHVEHEGLLAHANGGTLYLDEISELPPSLQGKLLHFLQERSYMRVGGNERIASDVRVVTSSHRDLDRLVREGKLREDLYYRLNVVTLRTPTLRERRDDIPLLAMHFLRRHAVNLQKGISGFSERALGVLLSFDWPGNIRQLENCVERAVVLARGSEIEPRDLPRELMTRMRSDEAMPSVPGASLRELERYAILRTLEHVGGSTSKAAKILGISPRKIQYRLNEYRSTPQSGVPSVVGVPKE
ncbi:MAG: sigma-54 dependent transcriptional regulator [Nannocystaceae bacterium]